MRYTTFSKHVPGLADAVNLQTLMEALGDFFLDGGFSGGLDPYWGHLPPDQPDRSDEALRNAILDALRQSHQLTPEMLSLLRDGTTGDPDRDGAIADDLARMLDEIIRRLVEEGYLSPPVSREERGAPAPVEGPAGQAAAAARAVDFNLTAKGIDFLAYKTLRGLLGTIGRSSAGAHDTPYLSTGVEVEGSSRPYSYGDTLNLDIPATLSKAIAREGVGIPIDLRYGDLMVHQSEYRSSAATVLLLDCSHSMILYGEDRFTPAKKVALALTHMIRTQYPGDTLRLVLFHDRAEEIALGALPNTGVGPYHTNTAEGFKLARRLLLAQRKDMRQIIMITDGKPSAMTLPGGEVYINSMGLDPEIIRATLKEAAACRRAGIVINTFMLARERSLVDFVMRVSEICRGKAYFTTPMTLGQYILMDFMRRRTQRG